MKLFINTCLHEVLIAVISSEGLVDTRSWKVDRQESKKLLPNIDKMLKDNGLVKDDLKEVVVVIGPGSFTTVRIGFIVGRALAVGLKIDLVTMNTFEYLKGAIADKYELVYLNAGSGKMYKVDMKDASFELVEKDEVDGFLVSEMKVQEVFEERFREIMEMGALVKDVEGLEPNYVKEPNITKPKA